MNQSRIVYLVIAHADIESLTFLLRTLRPRPVYLYLPSGAQLTERSMEKLNTFSHVSIISGTIKARWAGYSILQGTIEALEYICSKEGDNSQIVTLSGNCVPVRPLNEFEHWLNSHDGDIYAKSVELSEDHDNWAMSIERMQRFYLFDYGVGFLMAHSKGLVLKFIRKAGRTIYLPKLSRDTTRARRFVGSQWMSYPTQVARAIVKAHAEKEFQIYRGIFAPDEVAIQSFLMEPRFIKRHAVKPTPQDSTIQTVSGTANYHYIREDMWGFLTSQELEVASKSGSFFARKVSISLHPELLDLVTSLSLAHSEDE